MKKQSCWIITILKAKNKSKIKNNNKWITQKYKIKATYQAKLNFIFKKTKKTNGTN